MSYVYREHDRESDWDEPRSVSVKRYVIPRDHSPGREFVYRHEDSGSGDRELVIRHSSDREDEPVMVRRYERDVDYYDSPSDRDYRSERDYYEREYYYEPYDTRRSRSAVYINRPDKPIVVRDGQSVIIHKARGPVYVNPRESDYEIVRRSEFDPRDDERYHRRRVRDRELSPYDSVSQSSRRHDDEGYSSDDSLVYVRKTKEYDDRHHHGRHLMSGALIGIGAAELLRNHHKKEGEHVSHGIGRIGRDIGAGALGAVAANAIEHHRSKSRHRRRSYSLDDDISSFSGHRHKSRARSRSHSRSKTLTELGLGAAAVAGAMALARSKSHSGRGRSRSRHHHHSSSNRHGGSVDDARSRSHRRKRAAEAGLAGAAVAGLVEKARSRSRSRHGHRSRSRSTLQKALPIIAAGVGSAAVASYYEKNKGKKLEREERSRRRSRPESESRSRSRPRSVCNSDRSSPRDTAGLIEYGEHPVSGRIPAEDYFGRPSSPHEYYSDSVVPLSPGYRASRPRSRSRTRSRSRSRARRNSRSLSSDSDDHRRSRHQRHSRPRYLEEAAAVAAGAAGLGYAAHEYAGHKEHKKAEKERQEREYRRRGSFEEPYESVPSHAPYPPPEASALPQVPQGQPADDSRNYYSRPPPSGYVPPPAAPNAPYPADYPPPPVAAPPPQPYGYPRPPPGADLYASRPRSADDMVSPVQSVATPSPDQDHARDGLGGQSSPRTSVEHRRSHLEVREEKRGPEPNENHHFYGDKGSVSESDSTIDLPDRFDSQGRLLPQREDDPLAGHFKDLLRGISHVLF
ncbi:hypothetical protein MPDQ_003227 [Monascus purpureus]|uniref:DUF3824 domain-containing protein n=1 Tax=Monascus purpureus TaxID=5098 RepID=A0A507QN43_MONPU|nr:hypothetical protein MPDQ_003227 [Monascus purpureus]